MQWCSSSGSSGAAVQWTLTLGVIAIITHKSETVSYFEFIDQVVFHRVLSYFIYYFSVKEEKKKIKCIFLPPLSLLLVGVLFQFLHIGVGDEHLVATH